MKKPPVLKSIALIATFIFAGIITLTFQSCIKDNFELDKLTKTEWNPNLAVPLVYSSLSIQDIITKGDKDGFISVGSDDFCTLIYNGNLFSLAAADLVQIPTQQQPNYSVTLTPAQIAALTAAGTVTASYTQPVTFATGTNNPKIDSLDVKSGTIDIALTSDFEFSGQINVVIPAAKKNGVVFSKILPFSYAGTVPVFVAASYDLAGYTFDMTNGGTTYNQFSVNYDVTLSGSGTPPSLANQISINQSLSNLKYNKFFGDLGQLALSPDQDTVDISIFKNALGTGSFTLVDPSVKVTISNSYGVPIDASISKLDGYTPPASVFSITGSPNPLPIFSPNFSQIGQTLTGTYTLSNANSNIVSVINNTPKSIIYKINSMSNPAGPTNSNFVTDSSRFKVDMEVALPFWGTAQNFVLMDTIPFGVDSALSENIESVLIRLFNSNGFPMDIDLQAYLTDSNFVKLDSLIIPNQLLLKSAIVNTTTGLVQSPSESKYDIVVTDTRLSKLKETTHMLIKAVASTTNNGSTNVKIYSHYKLDIKLGTQIKFKVKF